jgi:nucleotide-binding universal stress UspA family protein
MKVILAVDDSNFSEAAIAALSKLRPEGNEIRVLHVLQPVTASAPPQMAAGYAPELAGQAQEAEQLVARVEDKLRKSGFHAETSVVKGDVRESIVNAAKDWPADLIVMGSKGRSSIGYLLLGSAAESVVRHAPCSVLIARALKAV